jgi:hypothetical protein
MTSTHQSSVAVVVLLAASVSIGCPSGSVAPVEAPQHLPQGPVSICGKVGHQCCNGKCSSGTCVHNRCSASSEPAAPPEFVKIRRFWFEHDRDWVTVGSETTDEQLSSWGYVDRHFQFFAPASAGTDTIKVYRWYHQSDGDWVTFKDGDPDDATIVSWHYQHKTFSFYAYGSPGSGRVAVSRWWSEKDRDWVTIAEDEVSDATMQSRGYLNKHFLFYARSGH